MLLIGKPSGNRGIYTMAMFNNQRVYIYMDIPKNGWFTMENPINGLVVHPFQETSIEWKTNGILNYRYITSI